MNDVETRAGLVCLAQERMARTDQIIHPETRALLAYWEGLRNGRLAPFRIEIDPRDMACEARRLFIIEIRPDGSQHFRLAGSEIVDTFGMELRGLSTKVIMEGPGRDSMTALIGETLAEPGIGYARLLPAQARDDELWEMLLLPLRSESGRIDRLIGLLRQLVGVRDTNRPLPLRFVFDEVWIQPIEVNADEDALPQAGFAEEQATFSGLPAPSSGGRLTAIEGGRAGESGTGRMRRPPPSLRLIKDD